MNYANQQVAYVQSLGPLEHKKDERRENGTLKDFIVALNWDEKLDIMYLLNGNEYKMWDYLLKWRGKKNGYQLSPVDIEKKLHISESTYRRIKKRFIELGFLVLINKNAYNFIPYPDKIRSMVNELRGAEERAEIIARDQDN